MKKEQDRPLLQAASRFLGKNWTILFLMAISFLTRVFIYQNIHTRLHTDSITYLILSDLEAVRTPGYPLFIELIQFINDLFSITPDYMSLLVFVQMFMLGMLNCLLIYILFMTITKNKYFSLAVSLLYNLDYLVMGFEYVILTETLSITLLLLSILFYFRIFERKPYMPYAAGLTSSLLLLTRPSFLLFFLCLLFFTCLVHFRAIIKRGFLKQYMRPLIILVLFNLVTIGSWSVRNKIRYDYFGVSQLLPYQLRHYTNRFFHKYEKDDNEFLNRLADIYLEENCNASRFEERLTKEFDLSGPDITRLFLKLNIKVILDNPGDYLKQVPEAVSKYYGLYTVHWTVPNQRKLLSKKNLISRTFRFFFNAHKLVFTKLPLQILFLVISPLLLIFLVYKDKKLLHLVILIEGTINYNFLVLTLTCNYGDNMRYRVSVEPLILLIFWASVFMLFQKILKRIR